MNTSKLTIDQDLALKTQQAIRQGLLLLKPLTNSIACDRKLCQAVLKNEIAQHLIKFPELKFKSLGAEMKGSHGMITLPLYFTYKTPADEKPAGND